MKKQEGLKAKKKIGGKTWTYEGSVWKDAELAKVKARLQRQDFRVRVRNSYIHAIGHGTLRHVYKRKKSK